ncbi:MAG: hypothetical protein NT105_23670 [Verrucomicrobia bacterium]|nr:hypothetical protein [Verrucomicrobiota bacterium]
MIIIDDTNAPPAAPPATLRPLRKMIGMAASFTQAWLTARHVPADVRQAREAVCAVCEYRLTLNGNVSCVLCGCRVNGGGSIRNLSGYEENLPRWGCKHPARSQGKGWPLHHSNTPPLQHSTEVSPQ